MSWVSGGDRLLHQHMLCRAPAPNWGVSWSPKTEAIPAGKAHMAGMKSGLRAAHGIAWSLALHSPISPGLLVLLATCGRDMHRRRDSCSARGRGSVFTEARGCFPVLAGLCMRIWGAGGECSLSACGSGVQTGAVCRDAGCNAGGRRYLSVSNGRSLLFPCPSGTHTTICQGLHISGLLHITLLSLQRRNYHYRKMQMLGGPDAASTSP